MKKFLLYILFFIPFCSFAQNIKTINVTEGDNLEELLGDKKYEIDSLVVTGYLKSSDFSLLRDCCYYGKLRGVNLFECNVEGDSIPSFAFWTSPFEDKGIEYITLPKSLKKICKAVFQNTNLHVIELPSTLNEIGDYAFCDSYGGNYKKVVIPEGVESIGYAAFKDAGIDTLVLASTVHEISDYAFSGIAKHVEFKEGLEKVGIYTFRRGNFEELILPESLVELSAFSFNEVSCLKRLVLPRRLKEIPDYNFTYGDFLESIAFPEELECLGNDVFNSTYKGKCLIFPESLKRIGEGCFGKLPNLEQLVLPSNIEFLGRTSFGEVSSKLKSVYIKNPIPPQSNSDPLYELSFIGLPDDAVLYVPVGSLEAYKACDFFGRFKQIKEITNFPTGIDDTFVTNSKFGVIGGKGLLTITSSQNAPYRVYMATGELLYQGVVKNGSACLTLNPGLYLVNVDGFKKKVLVK